MLNFYFLWRMFIRVECYYTKLDIFKFGFGLISEPAEYLIDDGNDSGDIDTLEVHETSLSLSLGLIGFKLGYVNQKVK